MVIYLFKFLAETVKEQCGNGQERSEKIKER